MRNKLRHRRLNNKSDTPTTEEPQTEESKGPAAYYGLAYKEKYTDFYYGNITSEDGSKPMCFPDDFECQEIAGNHHVGFIILGVIIFTVLIIASLVYFCLKRRSKK